MVGDVVSIKCVPPTSFPVQVNIHWYHNYQLITPGAAISIDSSGTITFLSIKKSDEGMYFCDGTNSYLHVTRTSLAAYVTVHGKQLIHYSQHNEHFFWDLNFVSSCCIFKHFNNKVLG